MALVYRGTGPWGAGKGSRLTIAEGDNNVYELDQRILDLENNPPSAISITGVTQPTSTTLMFTLSDMSSIGPVTIPASKWNYIDGGWTAFTVFHINDLFTRNGIIYIVQIDHTSGGTFNAGITDGFGTLYYKAILALPADMLPAGGAIGTVLTKTGITDFQCSWGFAHYVIAGGTTGQKLKKVSVTDYDLEWGDDGLGDLTGVDVTGQTEGDFFRFDGYVWGPHALVFSDIGDVATPAQIRQQTITALDVTGTVSLDPTLGNVFSLTPTGNITLDATSTDVDADITIIITTSGTSSYNITPSTNFKSQGVLATGTVSGKVFTLTFRGDGTNLNETSRSTAM